MSCRYGANFDTNTAVQELTQYLTDTYKAYGLPLWLTEFALTNFQNSNAIYPSYAQQTAFMNAMLPVLGSMPFLERFSWFALPPDQISSGDTSSLFDNSGNPTQAGSTYLSF